MHSPVQVSGRGYAPGSKTPALYPVAISGFGLTFTASLPPAGAILLGIVTIGGLLYAAYRLATRNKGEAVSANAALPARGLLLLARSVRESRPSYLHGLDVYTAR